MADVDANMRINVMTDLFAAVSDGNLSGTKTILDTDFPHLKFKNISPTLLHQAANNKHCRILKYLVELGAYIDSRNAQQMTPLHVSANKGDTESVKMLIVHNADVNAVDCDNRTPLYHAVYSGFLECAKAILSVENIKLNIYRNGGWSPMHEASRFGHLECLKELIRCRMKVTCKTDDAWWTPGHMAASCGNVKCLKLLIDSGIDINAGAGPNHTSTLLHEASHFGHNECVELLLQSGADPTIFDGHDLPHHLASRYGQSKVLDALLTHFKENNKSHYIDAFTNVDPTTNALTYHNALHMASLYNRKECIKILLKHGAKHLPNAMGQKPLMLASSKMNLECMKLIIADIKQKYRSKETLVATPTTALHYLCTKTYKTTDKTIACACLLLNSGLIDINQFDEAWDISPCLFIAARNGATRLVQYLLTSGANPKYCHSLTTHMLNNPNVKTCSEILDKAKSEPKTLLLCCRLAIRKELCSIEDIYEVSVPKFFQNYIFHGHFYNVNNLCDFERIK